MISIGYGCDWVRLREGRRRWYIFFQIGTIAHEIEHTLGVWHTQARYDRGNYVSINAWNVLVSNLTTFQ